MRRQRSQLLQFGISRIFFLYYNRSHELNSENYQKKIQKGDQIISIARVTREKEQKSAIIKKTAKRKRIKPFYRRQLG